MTLEPTPLQPDPSCCNHANWCTELPPLDPALVEALLEERGWQSRCRHPRLKVLRRPEGHEIAWVVPTGRVQIRVDLGIPAGERHHWARRMYGELWDCLRQMRWSPGEPRN